MDLQKLMDSMNEIAMNTRADYHLTLGGAIEKLKEINPDKVIKIDFNGLFPCEPHSYRGYYSDLALDWCNEKTNAGELLKILRESLGSTFEGYKGGDFTMTENTPLWISPYGTTCRAAMSLLEDEDEVVIVTKEDE